MFVITVRANTNLALSAERGFFVNTSPPLPLPPRSSGGEGEGSRQRVEEAAWPSLPQIRLPSPPLPSLLDLVDERGVGGGVAEGGSAVGSFPPLLSSQIRRRRRRSSLSGGGRRAPHLLPKP